MDFFFFLSICLWSRSSDVDRLNVRNCSSLDKQRIITPTTMPRTDEEVKSDEV